MLKTQAIVISEAVAYVKHGGVWWENNGGGVCTFAMPDYGWNWATSRPLTQSERDHERRQENQDAARFNDNMMRMLLGGRKAK